jgi:vitamin B12 transporter
MGLNAAIRATDRFFISTNLMWTGKRKDAYYDTNTYSTVSTTLNSYLLWDIYAEYSFLSSRLKWFADLRNITATKYTEISGFNTLGFNGYSGIRFRF